MRFTKIPLIATLMAVALSLLIVLPGLAQSYNDTRGTLSGGDDLRVDVLNNTDDDTGTTAVDESIADSYFNSVLYVSNSATYDETSGERTGGAYNRVRISAEFPQDTGATPAVNPPQNTIDGATDAQDFNCGATATVRNSRTNRSYTVYLSVGDADTGTSDTAEQSAVFEVVGAGTESRTGTCASTTVGDSTATPVIDPAPVAAVFGRVPARHGDTLTITVAGVRGSVTLTVDGEGPEFSEISPEHNRNVNNQGVKVRFAVTDGDSGLAHDGELVDSQDTDPSAVNGDDDNFTTNEPLADSDGSSRDIQVEFNGSDKSSEGTNDWRQRGAPGTTYALDFTVGDVNVGRNSWQLIAKDRAGNETKTDSDPDTSGSQPFNVTVDISSPEFLEARTGVTYDDGDRKEVPHRSYIALTFKDDNGNDPLNAVDADKFLVDGADVVDHIHLTDESDCTSDDDEDKVFALDGSTCIETPLSHVYLELAEPLAPDATPNIQMFGGAVLDLAGNPSNRDEIDAVDRIAPAVTVTMTTDVTDRPVIRNNGEVAITISADEELRRLPIVFFAEIRDTNSTKDKQRLVLGAPVSGDRVRAVSGSDNSWERTYTYSDVGNRDGAYAVMVTALDGSDNLGGTPGWTAAAFGDDPSTGDSVKLSTLESNGLLLELDKSIADPVFALSPETDEDSRETESNNPFVTIDFKSEKDEYGDFTDDDLGNFGDSHSAVAITSITLNGSDVSDQVSAVSNRKYTAALRNLGIGSYELEVTGRDDAGNTVTDSYEFSVAARDPYEIDLIPGWNLVSLPGTPLDSSVQAVMSDSMQASIVLAYQDDAWLTSVNDQGTWRGTLTDIVGGYGYWVQTTAFESISALIPETDTSSVLPTARVIAGWNLLGVVDVQQNDAGDPPAGSSEADDYFDNFDWKVAYSFNTEDNTWEKAIPGEGSGDEILNGKGYWVWSTETGTLVP